MREPTVWMNVTTSVSWARPPVGIVRVEREVAAGLSRLYGARFRLCIWSDDRFVTWMEPSADGAREVPDGPVSLPPPVSNAGVLPWMFPLVSRREAFHAIGQGLLSLTPGRLRPFVNRMLYRLRWRISAVVNRPLILRWRQSFAEREARVKLAKFLPSKIEGAQGLASDKDAIAIASIFERGDVLVSVGLDWDRPYYKQFYALREDAGVRVVSCCYDLIPVLFPQYCVGEVASLFTSYFLDVADGSDLVLCISRQSERDFIGLMNRTGGARPKTHVFPLGDNVPAGKCEGVSEDVSRLCREPFLLFVSTIERRKNHEVLYRAYHLLASQGKAKLLPKLVFVGMQGWGVNDLMKDIELDPSTKGLIVRLNHVTDSELSALYQHAMACLYPSLYEGWGLPVGEALAMGKPVLCSDRGSLPEVGGDLVCYVDPWQPQAWAENIWKLVTDEPGRMAEELRIRQHYVPRTWHEAAESIKQAIDSLL